MKIRKGDTVKVLYGKDSGKQGLVVRVFEKAQKVVVDGVNLFTKNIKGDGQTKKSQVTQIVKPMPVAKVSFICPECKKSTRVGMKDENGNMVRFCKKCGKIVDQPKKVAKEVKTEEAKENKVKKSNKK